ncbi:MAG TPA: hypothetical protein VMU90_05905 [Solirubrobacteraceae bacterium]|nr:hypothetical protein [Solirubrobacteraceae bacterium]
MRRTLIMTLASTAVLAVAPGAALAHGHHHGGKHKGHRHSKVEKFGAATSTQQSGGSTSGSSSSDTAGTVSSFSGGVLVIQLNDGSMVTGKVTPDTEIECQAPAQTTSGGSDENGGDGSQNQQSGGGDSQTAGGHDASDTSENDASENANEDQQAQSTCDSSALTPGAVVREAELKLSGGGATWKKVDLQK